MRNGDRRDFVGVVQDEAGEVPFTFVADFLPLRALSSAGG
jgi:hypothetical protein